MLRYYAIFLGGKRWELDFPPQALRWELKAGFDVVKKVEKSPFEAGSGAIEGQGVHGHHFGSSTRQRVRKALPVEPAPPSEISPQPIEIAREVPENPIYSHLNPRATVAVVSQQA